MKVRRVAVLFAVSIGALAMVALTPALAYACTEPEFTLLTDRARAGDIVEFTVSNTEPGAGFGLSTDGWHKSFSDDSAEQGYRGSFEMPDLGDGSRTVSIQFTGGHDDQTFAAQGKELQYVVDAPASQSEPENESNPKSNEGEGRDPSAPSQSDGRSEPDASPNRETQPVAAQQPAARQAQQSASKENGQIRAEQSSRAGSSNQTESARFGSADSFRPAWELRDELSPRVAPVAGTDGKAERSLPDRVDWQVVTVALLIAATLAGALYRARRRPPPAVDNVVSLAGDGTEQKTDRAA